MLNNTKKIRFDSFDCLLAKYIHETFNHTENTSEKLEKTTSSG